MGDAALGLVPRVGLRRIKKHFSLNPVSREAEDLRTLLNLISVVVILAAFPLITLISAMVTHERQREIGLLRAMGAKKRIIILLILTEAFILAAAGGCAGVAASLLLIHWLDSTGILASVVQISFGLPPLAETGSMAAIALAGVIDIGTLATLYPAYQSSVMNEYNAILMEGEKF